MTTGISSGKRKGLEAVADSQGVIATLAIDQRGAMRTLFAKAMGVEPASVPGEMLVTFKEAVSRILTPQASAILLDPEYGLTAAQHRAKCAGLLLAYEQTGYDKQVRGRMPRLLEGWTVERLVEAGADSVKLRLYYSTLSSAEINDTKHEFVRRVGAECAEADVPFFLELVSYGEGRDDASAEFAAVKPEVVARSMAEFSRPAYRVDVLKVGVPVNMAFVEGSPAAGNEILYSREEAMDYYRRAAEEARVPFIYLSQGVSNETFQYALELAAESQVNFSGVLCGRATWKNGVAVFVEHGLTALEDWLHSEGARNIENVHKHLRAAQPWFLMSEESHSEKR
jgi:tagatose 1,6-diphosphate aldolase